MQLLSMKFRSFKASIDLKGCLKRYTDPSSLRKHVKTFNHDNLSQNQKPIEKSDESMDCELSSTHDTRKPLPPDKSIYFDTITYSEVLESNERISWMTQRDITDKMETIKLDQPLDLSLRHNR